jgi:mono/diheme cytochrome c family protein
MGPDSRTRTPSGRTVPAPRGADAARVVGTSGEHTSVDFRIFIETGTTALAGVGIGSPSISGIGFLALFSSLAQAGVMDQLFRLLLAAAAVVFLAVEGVLLYAVFRSRHPSGSSTVPSVKPSPGLEIVWTLIPAVLVIVIAVFSFRVLAAQSGPGDGGGETPSSQDVAAAGRQVFFSYGCGACHTLKAVGAKGTTGPNLDGIGGWAGTVVPGMDAESFLTQSILVPGAYIASGFENGIMPANFSSRLSTAQLSGLVAFLMAQD